MSFNSGIGIVPCDRRQGDGSAWGEDNDMRQFCSETESAMNDPHPFRPAKPAPETVRVRQIEPGVLSRLLGRS